MVSFSDSLGGHGQEIADARRRSSARKGSMKYSLRVWHCRNCGRTNKTEIARDGRVECETCHEVIRIQPSLTRGGELPGQLPRSRVGRPEPTA
jgi:hypothetical protein